MALTKISGSILKDPLNLGEVSIGGTLTYQDVTNVDSVGIITARSTIDAQGSINLADSIIHTGDTDTKIAFTNNQIDLQCAGVSRLYANNFALYVKSGFPLAFLASSGASPNIKSGGTNNQDLLLTTGAGNPTRIQIKSDGKIGIGITNPDCMLHVAKASAGTMSADGNAVLAIENNNHCVFNMMSPADKSSYIMMGDPDDINAGQIRYDNNINNLLIDVNGGERFRIGSDGALTSTANNNGQIIHSFRNDNTTAGSSAMTVEHWFRFNRTGGGMNASAARIIAGKEREWIGGASNQDGYFAVHTTADETSSEKMRISSGGIMTRPYQPAFSAQGVSSPVDSSEGYTGILSNYMTVMECNVGSHYKTSGSDIGNFVAPVAGNYFFIAGCLMRLRNSSSAGSAELTFHKNGSNISNRSLGYSYVVGSNDHDNLTISAIIPLAAGDKVALVASSCSSTVDWYWGEGLGNFNGYLIG